MKNRRKIYQDPREVLQDYSSSEVKLANLPIFIVILLLFVLLGWYFGKHPQVQEFIKKLSETQQAATLKPSPGETVSAIPQEDPTTNPNQDPSEASTRTRTPQEVAEIQRQWREWQAWTKKAQELRVKVGQAHHAWSDLIPETADEVEQYQTDKEWQRKAQEAADNYDEVLEMMQKHEANRVLPPPQSFRQ